MEDFRSLVAPPSEGEPGQPSYFLLIDILRGLAAFVVVMNHYRFFLVDIVTNNPPDNYLEILPFSKYIWKLYLLGTDAVFLFWAISGFVFAVVYHSLKSTTRTFVIHRIARLYPLHLVTLFAVAILQIVAQREYGDFLIYKINTVPQFVAHLFLASNWYPTSVQWQTFNGPIWSVSLEILIYVCFWMVLPYLFRHGAIGPAVMTVVFAALFWVTGFLVFECGMDFFGGTIVFMLNRRLNMPTKFGVTLAAIVLAKLLAQIQPFPKPIAMCFAVSGIVLAVAALEPTRVSRWLSSFRWVGDCTYGIYLWHFPLILLIMLTLGPPGPEFALARQPLFLFLFLGSTAGIAFLSYRIIEKPARNWIKKWGDRRSAGPVADAA